MKSALEETVSSLPQVAAKTLFRYLDIHKPRQSDDVKKRPQLTPEFIETVSNQAKELEKQIKITSRRITESKREQVHLAEQIENLKNKFIKDQEVTLISELLDKVPSSRDLERIQKLNEISLEWKQQQRNIEKVQTRIEALNKVMANLDVIIQVRMLTYSETGAGECCFSRGDLLKKRVAVAAESAQQVWQLIGNCADSTSWQFDWGDSAVKLAICYPAE